MFFMNIADLLYAFAESMHRLCSRLQTPLGHLFNQFTEQKILLDSLANVT
jgi:hypothetical protein